MKESSLSEPKEPEMPIAGIEEIPQAEDVLERMASLLHDQGQTAIAQVITEQVEGFRRKEKAFEDARDNFNHAHEATVQFSHELDDIDKVIASALSHLFRSALEGQRIGGGAFMTMYRFPRRCGYLGRIDHPLHNWSMLITLEGMVIFFRKEDGTDGGILEESISVFNPLGLTSEHGFGLPDLAEGLAQEPRFSRYPGTSGASVSPKTRGRNREVSR